MAKVKVEDTSTWQNKLKWLVVMLLGTASVIVNYHYSAIPLSKRMIGWLVIGLVMLSVMATTNQGKLFKEFAQEAHLEVRKIVWPTKQETLHTTLIVLAMVLFMGVVLWVMDALLFLSVGYITGQKG